MSVYGLGSYEVCTATGWLQSAGSVFLCLLPDLFSQLPQPALLSQSSRASKSSRQAWDMRLVPHVAFICFLYFWANFGNSSLNFKQR